MTDDERVQLEVIAALGKVRRHRIGTDGERRSIGVVEAQQAYQVVTSLIADRDCLRGRVQALEQERDQLRRELDQALACVVLP